MNPHAPAWVTVEIEDLDPDGHWHTTLSRSFATPDQTLLHAAPWIDMLTAAVEHEAERDQP